MEKPEFYIKSNNLEYTLSEQKLSNNIIDEYDGVEIPSVSYLNLKYEGEIYLPLSIFKNKIPPLQIIVKYLRENLSKSNKQTSLILNRDPKTTWVTYKSVEKKKPLDIEESLIQFPISIFRDRRLSILEALVSYLKNLDMKYSEIARLLDKDQRTVWTVFSRARKKIAQKPTKQDEHKE